MSTLQHSKSDPDSSETDSITSSPQFSIHASNYELIRFICSFGGNILPRRQDNQLRYVGGDTRIVAIYRSSSFPIFINKLSKLSGIPNVCVKYQLPNEDLDSLVSVTTDEDMENMMEEYERAACAFQEHTVRFRLFLSPVGEDSTRASAITSLLDGSAKRENWFLDTLTSRSRTECTQSECSEPPEYLLGLDYDAPSDQGSPPPVIPSSLSFAADVAYPFPSPENHGSYVYGSHFPTGPVYYLPPVHPGVPIGGQYVRQQFHGPVIFQHVYSGLSAVGMSPYEAGKPTTTEVNHQFARTSMPVRGIEVHWRTGPNV